MSLTPEPGTRFQLATAMNLHLGSIALFSAAFALIPALCVAVPTSRHMYKLPAVEDPKVLVGLPTELWAEVHRPRNVTAGPYPLVIFIHGNHATCGTVLPSGIRSDSSIEYTFYGRCTPPSVVVPSHEGYRYVAAPLAKLGIVVVSINANRGITANRGDPSDFGLILARGRLMLSHMAQLAKWNRGEEDTPDTLGESLLGQIDFSNIGFMGHSRGGEGARAALNVYNENSSVWPALIGEKLGIKGIFEIAPVDGQSGRELNVPGVASNILLPTCDGDIMNLEGMRVFDRVFQTTSDGLVEPKSTFTVIGANHNGFNSEWQHSESWGCVGAQPLFSLSGPSPLQQKILKVTLLAFMRAHILGEKKRADIFDPSKRVSDTLRKIAFYERGHLRAPPSNTTGVQVIQNFSGATWISDNGHQNEFHDVTVKHASAALSEHDVAQRTAQIYWDGGRDRFYTINFKGDEGLDFTRVKTVSFRIAVACSGIVCDTTIDDDADVGVRVSLVNELGQFSDEAIVNRYVKLRRPTGLHDMHDMLRTVEIPLSDFTGVNLAIVTKMRFTLASPNAGRIFLGQISTDTEPARSTNIVREESTVMPNTVHKSLGNEALSRLTIPAAEIIYEQHNQILSASVKDEHVEMTFMSSKHFPITNSLPYLTAGGVESSIGLIGDETWTIVFVLEMEEFNSLKVGDKVSITIGGHTWRFGGMPIPSSLF